MHFWLVNIRSYSDLALFTLRIMFTHYRLKVLKFIEMTGHKGVWREPETWEPNPIFPINFLNSPGMNFIVHGKFRNNSGWARVSLARCCIPQFFQSKCPHQDHFCLCLWLESWLCRVSSLCLIAHFCLILKFGVCIIIQQFVFLQPPFLLNVTCCHWDGLFLYSVHLHYSLSGTFLTKFP